MKILIKTRWIIITLVFFASQLILHVFDVSLSQELVLMIGYPLNKYVESLRVLSLSSSSNNILAWIIFCAVGMIPIIVGIFLSKKDKKNKPMLMITSLLSCIIFYIIYGMLQGWFLNDSLHIVFEEAIQIYYFIGTLIILFSIITMWIIYLFLHSNNQYLLIHHFQWILFLSTIIITLALSVNIYNLSIVEVQHDFILFVDLLSTAPILFFIILLLSIITLLESMKHELFSHELLKPLQHIVRYSKIIVLLSCGLSLMHGLVQLALSNQLSNVDVQLNIPINELIVAFVIMFVSELLVKAIKTDQENKQFV